MVDKDIMDRIAAANGVAYIEVCGGSMDIHNADGSTFTVQLPGSATVLIVGGNRNG